LARRLAALLPGDLNHVFFSDSGSVAVEVAMKMAVQAAINRGERGRTRFLGFRDGYHGDTLGAMSVCDPDSGMHARLGAWVPTQIIADLPRDAESAARFEALMDDAAPTLAAVILEPLVQGAGGMRFHGPETLRAVAESCRRRGIPLILDEIFTGFGRTGTMFACERAGIVPDIICLSKALTGGTITLAATIARTPIFEAFWSDDAGAALMHGPTFMANPLACAAANASLDLFATEPRLTQVAAIEAGLRAGLGPCRRLPGVVDVRVMGAIGVVQIDRPAPPGLRAAFFEAGCWIRPLGDVVYLTPAFTIGAGDLETLCAVVRAGLATERE
jgi:adenosylmethionine-8-amino-7-oxononanoate aminotransferase